ncbi:Zinc finger BED domain-containing protein DAYSLEEPER [Glycine max]|nr:Zinc finger BED domain-containing protein DAYSLEEPER [Glycine max]
MAIDMKTKFDKYWSDYSNVLSFRCILDPRCKIKLLKYSYSKLGLDPILCQAKLKVVEHKLYTLYNEYVQMYSKETRSNAGLSQVGKSQLDTYLEETNLSNKNHPNLDVLQYWKDNQARFPDLSLFGFIQITTVASESTFSIGSRVLNKYRTRLLVDNVQALICTKN